MVLVKTFEKLDKGKLEEIQLTCEVNSPDEIDELSYDDFQANLYINHRFIADISPVLANAGVFQNMVDEVDWHREYMDR